MSDGRSASTGSPFEPIMGLARAVRIGNVIAVALVIDKKCVAALDAHAGTAKRFSHFSQSAGALGQPNG
jgi:hypothetical protein